ncbi:hypothetical protein U1Q18_025418 [Sarracenia purpurea var. burkii]
MMAFGRDDSDVGSPRNNLTSVAKPSVAVDSGSLGESNIQLNEKEGQPKQSEKMDNSESHLSMGEILSSMSHGPPQSVVEPEPYVEMSMNKHISSTLNVKRLTFWGRSSVSCSVRLMHLIPFTD